MSLTVSRPTQRPSSSTTTSFSRRWWWSSRRASTCGTPSRTVMTSAVISSLTRCSGESAKRMSRLVRMPTSRIGWPGAPPRSTTGKPDTPWRAIRAWASASVSSGKIVMGFTTMPLS